MPQLEGTLSDPKIETIRMYSTRMASRFELEQSSYATGLFSRIVTAGITDICSKCIAAGYYIVDLENGELSSDKGKWEYIIITVSLVLRVRRFADKLTNDEIYFWTESAVECVLVGMNRLSLMDDIRGAPIAAGTIAYTGIDLASGVDTRTATAVKEAERNRIGRPKEKSKRVEYNIIRRPKCSNPTS